VSAYVFHCLCSLISGDKSRVEAKHVRVGRSSKRSDEIHGQGSSLRLYFQKPQTTSPATDSRATGSSRTPMHRAVSPTVNSGPGQPVRRRTSASRQPRVLSPRNGQPLQSFRTFALHDIDIK